MNALRIALSVLALSLSATACFVDDDAPASPTLEPLPARTSLDKVTVAGRAEYLANVRVEGGADVATTTADAATGRFSLVVPLSLGENALQVFAVDADGNASAAATATVVREEARAERVRVSLERAVVDADEGTLSAVVQIDNDEDAIDLAALGVTLSVAGYGKDIPAVPVLFDGTGLGRAVLTGLDQVGAGTVVAEADVAAPDGTKARAEAGFLVLSGAPTSVALELSATVDGATVGPAAAIAVPPGTPVDAAVRVVDGAGNVVAGAPLSLEVPGADALVVGSQIRDLRRAGVYDVVARLGEGLLAGEAVLTILPGVPARIDLTVSPAQAAAGAVVTAQARLFDAFDNLVPDGAIALSSDIPAADLLGGAQELSTTVVEGGVDGTIAVRSAGAFTFTATATGLDGVAAATEAVRIDPGPPAAGVVTQSPSPLPAGETLTVSVAFTDQYANPTSSTFSLVTDAPGAIVSRDRVLGITRASEGGPAYALLVEVDGAPLTLTEDLVVVAGEPARIELSPSSIATVAGDTVEVSAQVVDRFGNRVRSATPVLTETSPQDFASAPITADGVTTAAIRVTTAGSFAVSATDGAALVASSPLVVVPGAIANGGVTPSPSPLPAGETLTVSAAFADEFGNPVPARFTVATDAPDAIVIGDRVLGVTRASEGGPDYQVFVQPEGGAVFTASLPVVAAAPDRMLLALDAASVEAGTLVTASAQIVDRFGNRVRSAAPALAETSPQDFSPTPASVDGVTTGTLFVTTAGSFAVTATDPEGAVAAAQAPLAVAAAAPVNASFFEIDAAFLPYRAGDAVFFNYAFVDAFGNVNNDVPLIVSVNAPNVTVVDDGFGSGEINGLVRAGTYTVRARAVGTGLPDEVESVVIDPNPAEAGFNLVLSSGLIAEGGTALFFGADGFGNSIPEAQIATTFSDASISRSGNQLTFARAGTFSVTACLVENAVVTTTCDTEFIGVQGILDTVPPTATVTIETPDPAATSEVAERGLVVFRTDVSDDRALAELRTVATFGNIGSCSIATGDVLFPGGTTSASRTFSFNVPGCAIPLDEVNIVAQAMDEAGNLRNSGGHTPLRVRAPFTITSPGFVVSLAAWEDELDRPRDVLANPTTAQLFVSNFGNDEAVGVNLDRFQFRVRDQNGAVIFLDQPQGNGRDAAGNLFFNVANNGANPGVVRLQPDFTVDNGFINYLSTPAFMAVDESAGRTPALCSALPASGRIDCHTGFSTAGVAPTVLLSFTTNLAGTNPVSLAIAPPSATNTADRLFVALGASRQIRELAFNGSRTALSFVRNIDLSAFVGANQLGDVVVAPVTENLIVVHTSGGRILRVAQNGSVTVLASGFTRPTGLAFDGDSLVVTDEDLRAVFRIAPDPANPGTF